MKTLLFVFAFSLFVITGQAQSYTYDVNKNGKVSVIDVTLLVNNILGVTNDDDYDYIYDVNGDGMVNVTDVTCLVNKILGIPNPGEFPAYHTCPDNHHPHFIDLGLPSGTKWACCNIGAGKPEEMGNYYAWGETEPKDVYRWNTYTLCDVSEGTYQDLGSDIAGTEYDVAHVKWGANWMMPSFDQIEELVTNCRYSEFTNVNGVDGRRFTGMNGGVIFLPIAANDVDYYWSSTQDLSDLSKAYCLGFLPPDYDWALIADDRYEGKCVRPVSFPDLILSESFVAIVKGAQETVNIVFGSGSYTVASSNPDVATAELENTSVIVSAIGEGQTTITVADKNSGQVATIEVTVADYRGCPDGHHPHTIDLGLPSGTKWACCNVGAGTPEAYGGYYAWGETEEKDFYDWSTYTHCNGFENTCHDLGEDIGWTAYDVAHVKWGDSWRMPSAIQVRELIDNCTMEWTTLNGIKGCKFYAANGKAVFLPAAGRRTDDIVFLTDTRGFYWSSTQSTFYLEEAQSLYFSTTYSYCGYDSREGGFCVRPVSASMPTLQLSTNTLCLGSRNTKVVEITSGSGNYTVESSNESVVMAEMEGNSIRVRAITKREGHAILTVTDQKSGQTATIEVTVVRDLQLSTATISLAVGSQGTVEVTSGSGSYTVETSDEAVATAEVTGNVVTVVRMGEGQAVITVTDAMSGQTRTIKVLDPLILSKTTLDLAVSVGETVEVASDNGGNSYTVISSNEAVATAMIEDLMVEVTAIGLGQAVITVTDTNSGRTGTVHVTVAGYLTCPDSIHPHPIDLGLPSGKKWACCNVGADMPEAYGGYFSWGEVNEKKTYNFTTYYYCDGKRYTSYNLGDDIANTNCDVAHVKWGGSWVMPSYNQFKELLDNCSHEWTSIENVNGLRLIGSNGGTIFLPAAGFKWESTLYDSGTKINYWTSSQHPSSVDFAYSFDYISGSVVWREEYRFGGLSVRPLQ